MTHVFLSEEWLDAVMTLKSEIDDQEIVRTELSIVMNQTITDVPFGDGRIEISVDTTSGVPDITRGHRDDAEVSITTDYDTAKATLVEQDEQAVMHAFMSGRILIEGDLAKLMVIQATASTLPPSEARDGIARRLRQLTRS